MDDVLLAARAAGPAGACCVDICCHGGRRVVERILQRLSERGAAIEPFDAAEPGLPWSACLMSRVDRALARTRTHRAAMFLLSQRTRLIAAFDAILQHLDEGNIAGGRRCLRELVDASHAAHRFILPAEIALVGAPNVGKSSLFNRLGGREGAIVTDRAGTTRDWVCLDTAFRGVPVTLIDTAGHRSATEEIEEQAIAAGIRRAASVDVIVLVVDASATAEELHRQAQWNHAGPPDLLAVNKIDLGGREAVQWDFNNSVTAVAVSARTGTGIDALKDALLDRLGLAADETCDGEPAIFDPPMRARLKTYLATAELDAHGERVALIQAIVGNPG